MTTNKTKPDTDQQPKTGARSAALAWLLLIVMVAGVIAAAYYFKR